MKKLSSYEVLNKEVFYRGMHILDYLYSNEKITPLDIEAIRNTILSSLVERGLINPNKEYLDLSQMAIVDEFYFGCDIYNPKPFVQGFPLWLKEEMRKHSLHITGSIPVALHSARPTGGVQLCIYDANTVISALFEDFAFSLVDYDSPTRPGVRATDRPFLEVPINGTVYLVDILTKRLFEKKQFEKRYNMETKYYIRKSDFDDKQVAHYAEDTKEETIHYGSFLSVTLPIFESLKDNPRMQEYMYELEESKKYFPRAFEEVEEIKEDMKRLCIGQFKIDTKDEE